MRTSIRLALGASILGLAAPAGAATFFFTSGTYAASGNPNPLLGPDILEITTGSSKIFDANFTNQSGTVNWRSGTIFLGSGAAVTTASDWFSFDNLTMTVTTGGGTFVNTGRFANAGIANSTGFSVFVDNSGILDASDGSLVMNGGGVFRSGSQFLGTGTVAIRSNGSFLGTQSSQSLSFEGATFTGTGALLTGAARWTSGTFNGDWTLDSGATLAATTGSSKLFTGAFVNNGTIDWQDPSTAFFGSGGTLTNNGLVDINATSTFTITTGGGTFVNGASGELHAANGTTFTIANAFVNQGGLLTADGIINYNSSQQYLDGTRFAGGGANRVNTDASFSGAIQSENLELRAGTFSGSGAELGGSADWYAGTFTGDWTLTGGSALDSLSGANRGFGAGTFTNNGTMTWRDASTTFFGSGGQLVNNGAIDFLADTSFANTTGGGTFTNAATGIISTAAGATWSISSGFVNDGGTIASEGIANFNAAASFNDGTSFTGLGASRINAGANFAGDISSENLELRGGTFTGSNAVLSGAADWYAGTMAGTWSVSGGSEFALVSGNSKVFQGGAFVNEGTVNWNAGTVFLGGNASVTNSGQWNLAADETMAFTTGGGQFINDGTLSKTAGVGTSTFGVNFSNNGIIDAQTGAIRFTGGNIAFNDGSVFTGAGAVDVNTDATYNGAFSSTNLNWNGGTQTGNAAMLSGVVDFNAGTIAGGFTVAGDGQLNLLTGNSKVFQGTNFVNAGAMNWSDGTLFLGGGAALNNQGTFTFTGNNTITNTTGGGSLTNNGLIEKTAGGGTSTIGVAYANNGTMNVTSGTIALPANFVNDGALAGTGSYSVGGTTGLTNNGTIAPGDIGMTGALGLTGNYRQTASGTLATQIASSVMFDLFNITGTASLDGTLALSCFMGCNIYTGDSFTILNSNGNLSGIFSNVTTSGFANGFMFDVIYDYTNSEVRLSILDAGMMPNGGVPEPATWSLLILGFGMIGSSLRSRSARRMRLIYTA